MGRRTHFLDRRGGRSLRSLVRLDIDALFDDVIAAPEAAGLTDVDDACLTVFVIGHAICETPNRYLFRNGIHPTRTGHDLIAETALLTLTSP